MSAAIAYLLGSPLMLFLELNFLCGLIFFFLVWLKKRPWGRPIVRFSASMKLAVLVITGIGIISAVGTFVEARYDLRSAQRMVYQTVWMWGILGLLCFNLIGVMADRWPWKRRHTSFVVAHIGIIFTLIGSVMTYFHGVDGSMRFGIGQSNSYVSLGETDMTVWASYDGESYTKIFEREANFHNDNPQDEPFDIPLADATLKVDGFMPFAIGSTKMQADAEKKGGPAVRFQIDNPHVSVNKWLYMNSFEPKVHDLGPARVVLAKDRQPPSGLNEVILFPESTGTGRLSYVIHYAKKDDVARDPVEGTVHQGESFETGWMGLKFRVLRYFPHAEEVWDFKERQYPNQLTSEAARIDFNGKKHWMRLNSVVKLFTDQAAYIVSYGNRRLNLGVSMRLDDFRVGRYQGTMRAAAYESDVFVEGLGTTTISMNEPLNFKGFTFYQSSFEEDDSGRPTHSILSVNFDPGRWIKYLGSLLIVLGSILLFWAKKSSLWRAKA